MEFKPEESSTKRNKIRTETSRRETTENWAYAYWLKVGLNPHPPSYMYIQYSRSEVLYALAFVIFAQLTIGFRDICQKVN